MIKQFFTTLAALFFINTATAQNVGIGTTTPVNKLSVVGKVNITDSLGIGTTAPAGELHIKSAAISNSSIDQQQTIQTGSAGSTINWQSFTAGITGLLTKVELNVASPLISGASSGTINIYSGEGNSGTLLSTTSVTFQPVVATFQPFILSSFPVVVSGNTYTIEFRVPVSQVTWVNLNTANPYSGGRANQIASWDYLFKTYVAPIVDGLVVTNGNLGIGTTIPGTTLDVNGGIRTKYSGTATVSVTIGVTTAYPVTIPTLPAGWDYTNTVVLLSAADGAAGNIQKVKLTSLTNIDVYYQALQTGGVRFNWIIFKM